MDKILKLKEDRTALETRGRDLLNKEEMNADEANEVRSINEKIDILNVQIENFDNFKEEREVPVITPEKREIKDTEAEYRTAFDNYLRTGEVEKRALATGTASKGGYITPVALANEIIKLKANEGVIRNISKVITVTSDIDFPVASGQPTADYIGENGQYPESDNTFGAKSFKAKKFGFTVKVSDELLADSAFNLDAFLAEEASKSITDFENEKLCNGDGSATQAEGILLNAETGVTCASASAITDAEIISLIFSLKAKYRKGASFVMNSAVLSAVRKLAKADSKEIDLTRVDGKYILEGYPVYELDEMPAIATGKSVMAFGNFSNYQIADRLTFEVKRDDSRYSDYGQVGFRFTGRNDAHLLVPEAMKVMKMG